jgi:hemolysin III
MSEHHRAHRPFSPLLFGFTIVATLAAFCMASFLMLPAFTTQQFSSPTALLAVALATHLAGAFFEFFLHRYVLHAPLLPFLAHFYMRHERHHALTVVSKHAVQGKLGYVRVRNLYPIEEERQHEASFFPWYTLAVFLGICSIVLVPLQLRYPGIPIVWGGYIGATFSTVLYELMHMVEHWPLEWYGPWLESPRLGWLWRMLYSFHLRHHADKQSNEAISGFFGIPVPDLVFRTIRFPKTLYVHGELVLVDEFRSPRPWFFIRWLDALARRARDRFDQRNPGWNNIVYG